MTRSSSHVQLQLPRCFVYRYVCAKGRLIVIDFFPSFFTQKETVQGSKKQIGKKKSCCHCSNKTEATEGRCQILLGELLMPGQGNMPPWCMPSLIYKLFLIFMVQRPCNSTTWAKGYLWLCLFLFTVMHITHSSVCNLCIPFLDLYMSHTLVWAN